MEPLRWASIGTPAAAGSSGHRAESRLLFGGLLKASDGGKKGGRGMELRIVKSRSARSSATSHPHRPICKDSGQDACPFPVTRKHYPGKNQDREHPGVLIGGARHASHWPVPN